MRPLSERLPNQLRRDGGVLPIQRRTALATAASIGSMPLLGLLPEALAAEPGLRFGEPEPFSFELLIERAKAHGRPALRPAAAAGARRGPADRLRRARQAALPAGIRTVRRRPGRLPGDLPVPRRLLPEVGAHAHGRRRRGARDRLLAGLFHRHRRQPGARAAARHQRASRASGSRRAGCRATGASASRGQPSWVLPISAPSASRARSACPRAVWR